MYKLISNNAQTDWYDIRISRHWGLPGVSCQHCGNIWYSNGESYPGVKINFISELKMFSAIGPFPLGKLNLLRDSIKSHFPQTALLRPGCQFGELKGYAKGNPTEVFWGKIATLLVTKNVVDKLDSLSLHLPEVFQTMVMIRNKKEYFYEYQFELKARLSDKYKKESISEHCEVCGYSNLSLANEISIKQSSIPTDVDLFKVVEAPTVILCTEKFYNAVNPLGLDNLAFVPVETVNE
jgi:uncharacterized double-CXXCG motif protein